MVYSTPQQLCPSFCGNIFDNENNNSVLLLSNDFGVRTSIKSCIKYTSCSSLSIIFKMNVFKNVSKLFHNDKTNLIELDSNNTFIDCKDEITKYTNN